MNYQGGYYYLKEPLVKRGIYQHSNTSKPVSDEQMRALNTIQNTAWRANPDVYAVLQEALDKGDTLGCLPPAEDSPLPPDYAPEVWEEMSKEEKAEAKAQREEVHSANAKAAAHRQSLEGKKAIFRILADVFWFPMACDWRGRGYSVGQDLNPQGDDMSRGVLDFAEGRPLGGTGVYHLAMRVSGDFDQDKVSVDERLKWVVDNEELILDSANNPLDGERFWAEQDKPWQCLASCFAWKGYVEHGEKYVCHLPIPYDATCSGIQHISAMGLSEFGAEMVNVRDINKRADIYTEVAKRTEQLVIWDAEAGNEMAKLWVGHIKRNTVKSQVMCICYGATKMGMRQMLVKGKKGKLVSHLRGSKTLPAAYLTDRILDAIGSILNEGKLIMDWLQDCATVAAESDQYLSWTSPIGMQVTQAYAKRIRKRITTVWGQATIQSIHPNGGVDKGRMRQGIVPNVIHSYDAGHLYNTVNMTSDRLGYEVPWAMVHDSFATWAGETTSVMNEAVRESFYDIYKVNQLDHLHQCFTESCGVDLPAPPERGTLDISEVLRSPYFFS